MNKVIVNLENLKYNLNYLIDKNPQYKYYMAVVKANVYGLGIKAISTIIESGCNYLIVSSLDEAIKIRKSYKEIPILMLQPIDPKDVKKYVKYNITVSCDSIEVLKKISNYNLKIHLKINTGMNRFGFESLEDFKNSVQYISNSNLILEGIYTHLYFVDNNDITQNQIKLFESYINSIDYKKVPIIHLFNSQALAEIKPLEYQTGVRIGAIMHGITNNIKLPLKSTFSLTSKVISTKKITLGDTVGYDGKYKVEKDGYVAIIPIGYAHGLTRDNTMRYVYINEKKYQIIGNICMNCAFILVDEKVKVGDTVYVYKDIEHVIDVCNYRKTVPEENMTLINESVKRQYKKHS